MTSLTDRISKFVAEELDDLKDFMGRLSCSSSLQTDEYVNDGTFSFNTNITFSPAHKLIRSPSS